MPVRCRSGAVNDAAAPGDYPRSAVRQSSARALAPAFDGYYRGMASTDTADRVHGKREQPSSEAGGARIQDERPIGGYATLTALFGGLCVAFAEWMRRSDRQLPERVGAADLLLITTATHKLSRLITKERVTSALRRPFTRYQEDAGPGEVEEEARGRGLRLAVGELLICPYCVGMWIAAAFTAGLAVAPRPTRWIAAALTALFGSDLLQIAYKRAEQSL